MKCDQPRLWTRRLGFAAILILWAVALPAVAQAQTVTATLPGGTEPNSVAVNPATNKIYVANRGNIENPDCNPNNPCTDPGNVTVIDGATNSVTTLTKGTMLR